MKFKYTKMLRLQILFILASGLLCEATELLEEKSKLLEKNRSAPINIPAKIITFYDWKRDLAYSLEPENRRGKKSVTPKREHYPLKDGSDDDSDID